MSDQGKRVSSGMELIRCIDSATQPKKSMPFLISAPPASAGGAEGPALPQEIQIGVDFKLQTCSIIGQLNLT